MRALWKGHIRFSLVTIPVQIFKATQPKSLRFHLLHNKCRARLRNQRVCTRCGEVVIEEEIVKGYEYAKEQYVIMDAADFEKISPESTHTIDIVYFADLERIDSIYFHESYYLTPESVAGRDAFFLLKNIMEDKHKVAIGKLTMRNREHLVAIRPYKNTLCLSTLFYLGEVVNADELPNLDGEVKIKKDELVLGEMLVDRFSKVYDPSEFKDDYTSQLMDIINAKIKGEEIISVPRPEVGKVLSLMEALKKSVEKTKAVEIPGKRPAIKAKTKEIMAKKGMAKVSSEKRRKIKGQKG